MEKATVHFNNGKEEDYEFVYFDHLQSLIEKDGYYTTNIVRIEFNYGSDKENEI